MSVLEGLDVFVAICDAGSIAGAGRALGMPRATLSRQLSRLEEELGVRLLHRTTRRLVKSPAGEELYNRARRVLDDAIAAREAVRRQDDTPRGLLRLSVPPDSTEPFSDLFLEFLELHPHVQLEVAGTARHVDLVAEGFDVALRGGMTRDPNLIARRVLASTVQVFGSPAYLAAHGRPQVPEDLADHACIRHFARGEVPVNDWPLLGGGTIRVSGRLVCNSLPLTIRAALRGQGLALMPTFSIGPSAQELEPVLVDHVGSSTELAVVYAERALMLPKVRAFVDFMVERLPGAVAGLYAATGTPRPAEAAPQKN